MSILDEFLYQVENLEPGLFATLKGDEAVKELEELRQSAAAALGSLGGKSTSDAKRKASAENGKKGGRPKKIQE